MADKRMFSKKITDSDVFIELASSTQALYFHLNQGADDDGFNNQIQNAMFKAHASIDDLKVLLSKNFIIRFESGVIVIKHWRIHNTLRKDRYVPTNFQEELKQLGIKDNGAYTLNSGCQTVAKWLPQYSIDKNSIDKDSIADERISEITKCYEENIGMITSATAEILFSYLDTLDYKMIVQAIKIATQSNKRSCKYIQGILNSWTNKGYKVLADIQEEKSVKVEEKKTNYNNYQQREYTDLDKLYANGR